MKILHVLPSLRVGGTESFLTRLVAAQANRHAFDVVSLSDDGPIGDHLRKLGARVHLLGMTPGMPDPRFIWRLRRLLVDRDPDVVHTWLYHSDFIGGIAARLARKRALVWSIRHTNLMPRYNKPSMLAVARAGAMLSRILPRRIVCCAEAARTSHIDFGYSPDRMSVIPNGLDIDRFRPDPAARASVRRELGIADGIPVVGMLGRFHVQKNHRALAEAIPLVLAASPSARFVMAGRDVSPGNGELRRWLGDLATGSNVQLIGERSDAPALLNAFDILVLPSVGEGFPNVVCEAMATAKPCVVTDAGDAAHIVGDFGTVVPVDDVKTLARGIADMLSLAPEKRAALGERGRARILENFEIGAIARRYDQLYDAVLHETRGR